MYVFSAFEHSVALELAITDLERIGIQQEDILAVPLSKTGPTISVIDTMHRSDGESVIDGAAALGTVLMILGVIYGFILPWGPIAWGLIGLLAGFVIGLLADIGFTKRSKPFVKMGRTPEVILVVSCDEKKGKEVEDVLRCHEPLGVSAVDADEK
ncbi:Hypothetical protein LUCI_2176 [Lucifera butyrica]|uniref:DUF1269 domain-containing protein n=1 Tax=Lucifera butyrica TaxID=1351585 RepID=A0A498R644_9FIRM|nr:hypothetical protein [Lucifera butyrica]VBB06934.1 Hypothetical protein LUCI_2176 [Lucifera butyrica]